MKGRTCTVLAPCVLPCRELGLFAFGSTQQDEKDSGEMDSLSDFSAQDVPKVVACLWGILNQVLQYTQCRQIRHAE